jgi:hypothetical protein
MPLSDRIQTALSRLIEHAVPVYDDDDEADINQRWDEAYALAHDLIDSQVLALNSGKYETNQSIELESLSLPPMQTTPQT